MEPQQVALLSSFSSFCHDTPGGLIAEASLTKLLDKRVSERARACYNLPFRGGWRVNTDPRGAN